MKDVVVEVEEVVEVEVVEVVEVVWVSVAVGPHLHSRAVAGHLERVEDGLAAPVVRVQLDCLPVAVWALQHLGRRVDGQSVALEADLRDSRW